MNQYGMFRQKVAEIRWILYYFYLFISLLFFKQSFEEAFIYFTFHLADNLNNDLSLRCNLLIHFFSFSLHFVVFLICYFNIFRFVCFDDCVFVAGLSLSDKVSNLMMIMIGVRMLIVKDCYFVYLVGCFCWILFDRDLRGFVLLFLFICFLSISGIAKN
jgi:hypothetical protein